MHYKYNWKEIQEFYDLGNSWRDIEKKFGANQATIDKASKRGDFVSRSQLDAAQKRLKRFENLIKKMKICSF